MVKELQRKCSCCGNNGHNSRTCNGNGTGRVKLFGVDISENKAEQSIKRSFSLGNLKACDEENNSDVRNVNGNVAGDESGYLSDGLIHNKKRKDAHEKKKGVPWSEEEHRTFLAGLESVGRGNWREIARRFVRTRTPTQVASHAQKYYLRTTAMDNKKRRSSLFDMRLKQLEAESQTSQGSTGMISAEIPSPEKASVCQTSSAADGRHQTNAAKLENQLPHLRLDCLPGVPNYSAIPGLVGDQRRAAFIPAMNFGKQNTSTRNMVDKLVTEHPSGIPSPKPNSHKSSVSGESEKDGLELKLESLTSPSKTIVV